MIDVLNSKYEFYKIHNINIRIRVDSVRKLKYYNIEKKLLEIIDLNEYGIKNELKNILINRKKYVSYCKEYDLLIEEMKLKYSNDILSQLKLYFEMFIYRLKKKNVKLNFKVSILLSYTSPAGRNYYERRFKFNYDDLVRMSSNHNLDYTRNENIVERKNFIECEHCGKLLDFNAVYCRFCGKKQFDDSNYEDLNEKNLEIENNERDTNLNSLFSVLSNTFDKYGVNVKINCSVNGKYITINYSIKLIDKVKLADNYISFYISVHEQNKIISYLKEIECLCVEDFEDNSIIKDSIDIPVEEINIDGISKILVYGKLDV